MSDKMNTLEEIAAAILGAKEIAIFSHSRPDGDTLGANLGLGEALRGIGKNVSNLCEDEIPAKFCYMPGFSEFNKRKSGSFDLAVIVDCGDAFRLGTKGEIVDKCKNTINIDHHISNNCYAKLNFVKYYASTCEIILELMEVMKLELTPAIAACLYTGLSTDTGNFMHSNTDPHAFACAAKLSPYIADVSKLTDVLYKEMPKERLLLLSKAIPTIRFLFDDRFAIMTIRDSMLKETGAESSYTEGFVDYTVNVAGVQIGACVMEAAENSFKVSFRSKGADVCAVAERFGGGGHKCAAGCRLNGFYEDVIERIKREVSLSFECTDTFGKRS